VSRGEHRPGRGEHDGARLGVVARGAERGDQLPHVGLREGVPPLGRFMVMVERPAEVVTRMCS